MNAVSGDGAVLYRHLFQPIEIAGRRLKNRIVHASITTTRSDEAGLHPEHLQYFINRARGGAAMLVTEPLGIAPHQPRGRLRVWDASREDDLRRWSDAVEEHDCRLVAQIQDVGRGRLVAGRNPNAIGASSLPDDLSWTVPRVLRRPELRQFVQSLAEVAFRLSRSGFSGVELSAGHGHLFHQFLSPRSNRRDDEYGGSVENRARLLVEVSASIRAVCGESFIIGLKLPGDDGLPDGITPDLALRTCHHILGSFRPDYLCLAQGTHHRTLEMHVPNDSYPRVPYMGLARTLKQSHPGVPVMALGRITDPSEADAVVAGGAADLVGVGRALIADAAWPIKARQGRAADIRYCVSGNTCWRLAVDGVPLQCDNNPRVAKADEVEFVPRRAVNPRRIVVVGAGIAGMEAAWTAAARGHDVTVFSSSAETGGKTRLQAALPHGESLSSVYDYQLAMAIRHGVRLELGRTAGFSEIVGALPQEIVLATGATMIWPACLPETLRDEGIVQDLRHAMLDLLGRRERQKGRAVIFDMDHTEGTYAAAEFLHSLFDEVVIVTPRDRIAEDVALVTRQGIRRRLHEKSIRVVTLAEPRWSPTFEEEGALELSSIYGGVCGRIEEVAFFSYSTPRAPNNELELPLRRTGIPLHLVGDCKVARAMLDATSEGHAAGMATGESWPPPALEIPLRFMRSPAT